MAIEVTTTRVEGKSHLRETHKAGELIRVHDGHLMVQSHSGTVAVYAPGQWVSAKTVEETKAAQ